MHILINGANNSEYMIFSNDILLTKKPHLGTDIDRDIDRDNAYDYYVCDRSFKNSISVTHEEYERVKKILQCLNGDILKSLIGQVEDIKVREGLSKVTSALFRLDVEED